MTPTYLSCHLATLPFFPIRLWLQMFHDHVAFRLSISHRKHVRLSTWTCPSLLFYHWQSCLRTSYRPSRLEFHSHAFYSFPNDHHMFYHQAIHIFLCQIFHFIESLHYIHCRQQRSRCLCRASFLQSTILHTSHHQAMFLLLYHAVYRLSNLQHRWPH